MAEDGKDIEGSSSRGADWEVVSLTASAYAASPGPKGLDPPDQHNGTEFNRNEQGTSDALIMSGHFVFPPKGNENLHIEPNCAEICNELGDQDENCAEDKDVATNITNEDNWKSKSDDDLQGIQFFDKGNNVSVHDVEFGESKALHAMTLVGKDQIMYGAPEFGVFDAETNINHSVLCDASTDIPEADYTNTPKSEEQSKLGGSGLPCEAWWKRHAISLYSHVKEANKFWYVVATAAMMGLVILGQHWRREKFQLQRLKVQSNINSERMKEMAGLISKFKGVLVGGHQRNSLIREGAAASTHLGI